MKSNEVGTMSATSVRYFRSIDDVPGGREYGRQAASYYHSREGLRLAEDTNPGDISYVSVRSAGARSYVVPMIVATVRSRWVMGRPDRLFELANEQQKVSGSLAEVESSDELLPSLVCGGRQMGFSGPLLLVHPPGPADYREDMRELSAVLESEAASRGCATVSWPFVADPHTRGALRDAGYSEFPSGAWHTLESLHGFGGYLRRLSARRRRSVLGERRRLYREGYVSEFRTVDHDLATRLALLEYETLAGHGVSWSAAISSNLLRVTTEHFAEELVASTVTRGDALVAFCVFVRHGGALWPRHVGVKKSDERSAEALNECMFYRSIEGAHESGCTLVHLGFGSDDVKSSHGTVTSTHYSLTKRLRAMKGGAAS